MTDGTYEGDKNTDGKNHGMGLFRWSNGTSYQGQFKHGAITGRGTFKWPNGDAYHGDFINSIRTGRGTFAWDNGDVYQGEFKDSKLSGLGTFWYFNGNRYRGSFFDGKRHGQGVLFDRSTDGYYDCNFERGDPKSGTWTTQRNLYKGPFMGGVFAGRGIYTYPSGNSKQGNFSQGVLDDSTAKLLPDHVPTWSVPKDFYTTVPDSVDIIPLSARYPRALREPELPPGTQIGEGKEKEFKLAKFNEPPLSPKTPTSARMQIEEVSLPDRAHEDVPFSLLAPSPPPAPIPVESPSTPPDDDDWDYDTEAPKSAHGAAPPPPPPPAFGIKPQPIDDSDPFLDTFGDPESTYNEGGPTLAPGLYDE